MVFKPFLKVPSNYTLVSDLAMDSAFQVPWPRLFFQPVLPFPPSSIFKASQCHHNNAVLVSSQPAHTQAPQPHPCHNYLVLTY